MLKTLFLPVRLLLRSQQIAYVLTVHGLGDFLTRLGFEIGKRGLRFVGVGAPAPVVADTLIGKSLARAACELGPTFIKLGQILASRPDFVGDEISLELKVLFDKVPPMKSGEVMRILKRELGKQKFKESIQSIERDPIASASLGQAHRAVLTDGTPVIFKVQRKGAQDQVCLDLSLLETILWPVHLVYPKLKIGEMLDDFKVATLREIDYREEAKNIDRFRKNYRKLLTRSDIVFPRYFSDLSTDRVIALEPLHGKKLSDLRKGSTVARQMGSKALTAVLEQIFDHGFFHADPHAGNLFFLEDSGELGFIDLGLVGHLTHSDRQKFLKVLLAVLKRDKKTLARALYAFGNPGPKAQFDSFEKAVGHLLDDLKKMGPDHWRMDYTVYKLLEISREEDLRIPNRYMLLMRSCLLIEGVAKSLDPSISILKVAAPIVAKSLLKTYSPWQVVKRYLGAG